MQDFSHSLPMMLYRALNQVMPRFREIFTAFGLTETQWRVLRTLWERDAITVTELAETTLIPAPSLVGVLDRLARDGLIERHRSTLDRRSVHIVATRAGRELQAQVLPAVEQAYTELRSSLDEKTWRSLIHGLERLTHEKANGGRAESDL